MTVYSIVATGVDLDLGYFPTPEVKGTYISKESAEAALTRFIEAERKELDGRYDCEERSDSSWELYRDGEAAACFSRLDMLTSEIQD